MTLTGRERLVQHIQTQSISIDDIKTYITRTTDQIATNIITIDAGEYVGGHRVVAQVNGSVVMASNLNLSHMNNILGLTLGPANLGGELQIQFSGYIVEPSWSWNLTKAIYLSTNGLLTQTMPTTGFLQQIGTVISSNKVLISIQEPILLGG